MENWEIEKEARGYVDSLKDAKQYIKQITDHMPLVVRGYIDFPISPHESKMVIGFISPKYGECKSELYVLKEPYNGNIMFTVFKLVENKKWEKKEWLKQNPFGPYQIITSEDESSISSVVYNFSKDDRPSFIAAKGYIEWTNEKEQWHRIGGPALISPISFSWYENHKLIKREQRAQINAPEYQYIEANTIPNHFPKEA